ncbi:MAG: hypothetical protein QGF00_07105 [Planctomycetota bacterium]|nr:hypothetical protein [Planctomycetota bacterium]
MSDEDKMLVTCPYDDCDGKFNLAKNLGGRKVKCFRCHRRFIVGEDGASGRKLDKDDTGSTVGTEALEPISGGTDAPEPAKKEPAVEDSSPAADDGGLMEMDAGLSMDAGSPQEEEKEGAAPPPDGDDDFGGMSLDVSSGPEPAPAPDPGGEEEFNITVPPGGVDLGLGDQGSGGGDDMFGNLSVDAPESEAPADDMGLEDALPPEPAAPAAGPPDDVLGLGEPKEETSFDDMSIDAPEPEPEPSPAEDEAPALTCPACNAACQPGQVGCLVCGASFGGDAPGKKSGGFKLSKKQGIAALVILCPLIAIVTFRYTASSRMNSTIAEIGREGVPTSFTDLQESYSIADGEDNAAENYTQAFAVFEESTESPLSDVPLPIPAREITDETGEMARKSLDATKKAFTLISDGGKIEKCSYSVDLSKGLLAETPHLEQIENAFIALQWQAAYLAHRRDAKEAVQTVIDSLRLAESLSSEPFSKSHLAYAKGINTTVNTLAQVLSRVVVDAKSLNKLKSAFAEAETTLQEGLATAVGGEVALAAEISKMSDEDLKAQLKDFGGLGSVSTLYNLTGARYHDIQALITKHRETIQAAKENYVAYFKDLDAGAEPGTNPSQPLASKLANHATLWAANGRALMALKLAQTAVGLEAFALKKGEWPKGLDSLIPDFIDAVPQDVFNGEIVRYKKQEKGFSLYSVGANHSFDMGHVDEDIPLIVSIHQRKKSSTRTRTQLTGPEAEQRKLYSQFKSYLLNKKAEDAKKFHDQLISKYPDSDSAKKARTELNELLGPTELPGGEIAVDTGTGTEPKKEKPKPTANEKKARSILSMFNNFMLNDKPNMAKIYLKKLEKDFPDSEYYQEAKEAFENAKKPE